MNYQIYKLVTDPWDSSPKMNNHESKIRTVKTFYLESIMKSVGERFILSKIKLTSKQNADKNY